MASSDDKLETVTPETVAPATSRRPERDDDDEVESEVERTVRKRLETFIPDLVKRTFFAGISAVATTEEGIRKMAKDMSLPKDAANYLANTASSAKDEVTRIIAREIREFLQNVNLSEEIAKMLTTLSFEIKTEIRFIPNDQKIGKVAPDVQSRVRLKKAEDDLEPRSRRRRRHLRRKGTGDDDTGE